MKISSTASALLCITTINAGILHPSVHSPVAGSTGLANLRLCFSVPCQNCFGGLGDEIELQLDIPAAELECTSSTLLLNYARLGEDGFTDKGQFTFDTILPGKASTHEIRAFWQKRCLNGEATLLSVTWPGAISHEETSSSQTGFTISFKQTHGAKVLRIEDTPTEDIDAIDSSTRWLDPGTSSKLNFQSQTTQSVSTLETNLETEYRRLDQLKQNLVDIHDEIIKQEKKIFSILKSDFNSCEGFKCVVITALHKVPEFLQLLKSHVHYGPGSGNHTCLWSNSTEKPLIGETEKPVDENVPAKSSLTALPATTRAPTAAATNFEVAGSSEIESDDGQLHHDYHPSSTEDRLTPSLNPSHKSDFKQPHHGKPHIQHPAPRHPYYRLILATFASVSVLLILVGLFILLRLYLSNPRVQADRAARAEECRTRRAYRRAACKHKFKQIFSRFRREDRTSEGDYEEKREILRQRCRQNSASSSTNGIMRANINSLRRAHELVGELMLAEEGRARLYRDVSAAPAASAQEPETRAESSNRSEASFTTLPPYTAPPPRYSLELPRNMMVVNGFRYTPSQSATSATSSESNFIIYDDDGDATESSIVDCRSRISFETISAPLSRKSLELAGDRMRRDF